MRSSEFELVSFQWSQILRESSVSRFSAGNPWDRANRRARCNEALAAATFCKCSIQRRHRNTAFTPIA